MEGKPGISKTPRQRLKLKSKASSWIKVLWAWPLVAVVLAGCMGGSARLSRLPPPDPPPIPERKPPLPPAALAARSQSRAVIAKTAPNPRPAKIQTSSLAPVAAARPEPAAASGPAAPFTYVVQAGDTVYGISRKLGVPLRPVIDANALKPPYTLSVSQSLRIPNPRRHVVRRGETVYGISRGYGVEMTELVRLNGIRAPYTISLGASLVLPAVPAGVTVQARGPGKLDPPAKTAPGPVRKAAVLAPPKLAKPARLAAIPRPPPRAGSKFLWPAKGKLLATFGPKNGGLHNDGINISAPRGSPVRAAENGVVIYSGNELRGFGNLILIKHADGWVTAYAHTQDTRVGRGQEVKRGQTIAKVGSSGNVSRPQLHFEIRKGARAVDPRRLLAKSAA